MGLYQTWEEKVNNQHEDGSGREFFDAYLKGETLVYQQLLAEKRFEISGTIALLAQEFQLDPVTFTGFLDGINTSLETEVALTELTEESTIAIRIVPEKLYYNMLAAKAKWLYELPEWKINLSEDERRDIRIKFNQDVRATSEKVGRNDPCPCGSGKKYKKCCGA